MKKVFLVILIVTLAALLSSCRSYQSKADYFDGKVLVEYQQTTSRGSNDYLTLTFNQKGEYKVAFSYTKGHEGSPYNRGQATLPADFSISVSNGPISKVISQYVLPGFITVTITDGELVESHDFQ